LKTATVSRGVSARASPPVADRTELPVGFSVRPALARLSPGSASALSGVGKLLRGVVCAQGSVWCEPSTRLSGPRWARAIPLFAGPPSQETGFIPPWSHAPSESRSSSHRPAWFGRVRLHGFRRPSTASARELRRGAGRSRPAPAPLSSFLSSSAVCASVRSTALFRAATVPGLRSLERSPPRDCVPLSGRPSRSC